MENIPLPGTIRFVNLTGRTPRHPVKLCLLRLAMLLSSGEEAVGSKNKNLIQGISKDAQQGYIAYACWFVLSCATSTVPNTSSVGLPQGGTRQITNRESA